jgi:hypothetical protein
MPVRLRQSVTVALLAFAIAATAFGVVRIVRDASARPEASEEPAGPRVVVFYLHGDARCDKCVAMQGYSKAAVESAFAEELAAGDVAFREVNYHEPADAHYATEFDVSSPSLVIARYDQAGRRTAHQNLPRIWDLADDEGQFRQYVIQHVSEALPAEGR